ncbi:general secretion pathway protein GspL [Pseudomonas edaphica]|uniref:General secretion pathway protein GspL n=1 Tax=Pseudomonas edaphica TaxID=2006980 RepID=A0ABY2TW90_9PSED|nr:general secretion pathway protein GspL [Pseudomonas edaphica]TLG87421.1 general secretion pathway protein GspL [Pseudomonas edaphica]
MLQALAERQRPWVRLLMLRWQASSFPAFFSWWGAELMACLPASWHTAIKPVKTQRLLFFQGDTFCTDPWASQQSTVEPGTVVLVLLPSQLLIHELLLPAAAAQNLASVLSYEMDKYTPYKASQVYFDFAREPTEHRTLVGIRLAAVNRERLDTLLDQAQQAGHLIASVDVLDEHGVRLNVNLLPPHRRLQIRRTFMRPFPALVVVGLVLIITTMLLWLHNRQQALEEMQREVKALQQQTQHVQAINQQINDTLNAQRYVVERRAQTTSMSALLNELTQCITLDTTLEYLDISVDGQVSLTGHSNQASALMSSMKSCSSLTAINFQGAIQPDSATGKDRFTLLATLRKMEASHAPKTP